MGSGKGIAITFVCLSAHNLNTIYQNGVIFLQKLESTFGFVFPHI